MAGEGIIDWSKEGADYHEGDASIIKTPEEEVETLRMAGKKVGKRAANQASHSSS